MSDDRFARQNRFGLPPEFPLASSCTGIVHHLSGLSAYALPPPHCKQLRRGYAAQDGRNRQDRISELAFLHFHYAFRFQHPMTRTYAKLLGPCFKTGRLVDQLLRRDNVAELRRAQSITNDDENARVPPRWLLKNAP